ncbi:hypothetical protein ACSVC9_10305 [Clostridium sp. LBM24168]
MSKFQITLANNVSYVADSIQETVQNQNGYYENCLSLNFYRQEGGGNYDLNELQTSFSNSSNLTSIVIKKLAETIENSDGSTTNIPEEQILNSTDYQTFRSIYKYYETGMINICLSKSKQATELNQLQSNVAELQSQNAQMLLALVNAELI